jgi:hypothetical protein
VCFEHGGCRLYAATDDRPNIGRTQGLNCKKFVCGGKCIVHISHRYIAMRSISGSSSASALQNTPPFRDT